MGNQITAAELEDLKKATNFNQAELKEWHLKFMGDFPNGRITMVDFRKIYGRMYGEGVGTKLADNIFRAYDTDGNGEIDFKEFMTTLSVASKGTQEQKLRWSFKIYDIDGNGTVSREEARKIISASYKLRGFADYKAKAEDAANKLFDILKKGPGEEVTEDEFVSAADNSAIREILQGAW